MNAQESTTTRPYLIRALHEWCSDNGFTPYLAVRVDDSVQVPREYVKDGEIVLNVGIDATNALQLGNDYIEFTARFGGKPRDIMVPMDRVIAIYARENGQGMAFPMPVPQAADDGAPAAPAEAPAPDELPADAAARGGMQLVPSPDAEVEEPIDPPPPPPQRKRPALKRIK